MEGNGTRRLCIYHIFDRDGIVDDYVFYALDCFRRICSDIIVTVNGIIGDGYRKRLEDSGIRVLVRDNIGYDFGAWKDAIVKYVLDSGDDYDELVLTNDSYFGPFGGWENVFDTMGSRGLDFWGMTKGTSYNYEDIRVPVHIQSYLVVIGSRMLHSGEFAAFWREHPYAMSFMDCVARDEGQFARHFADLGFKWDVYCDTDAERTGLLSATYLFNSDDMLPFYGLPLVKKKTFVRGYDEIRQFGLGEDIPKSLGYIRRNTDYDTELITQNILRLYPVEQINDAFPSMSFIGEDGPAGDMPSAAVVVSLDRVTDFRLYAGYINDLPSDVKVIIAYTDQPSLEKAEPIISRQHECFKVASPSSLMLFRECREHISGTEYVCFMRCTDGLPENMMDITDYALRKSVRNMRWDNLLYSSGHVRSLVGIMKEKGIGLMVPPTPHNDVYLRQRVDAWDEHKDSMLSIAEGAGLRIGKDIKVPPLTADMFWCETPVLESVPVDRILGCADADGWDGMFVTGMLDLLLPYMVQAKGRGVSVAFCAATAPAAVRSHILALEASKNVDAAAMHESSVERFIARHGRIFGFLEKFEKKFWRL